jgi:STE24 endopeptidase
MALASLASLAEPRTILGLYLGLFALHFAAEHLLVLLNLRRARANAGNEGNGGNVPVGALELMSAGEYRRSQEYASARGSLTLWSGTVQAAVALALILTGGLGGLQQLWERIAPSPQFAELAGILLVFSVSVIFLIAELPASIYGQFSVEARFGFNRLTPRLYVLDQLKGLALSAALGAPLLFLVFRLVRVSPRWWLWAFLAAAGLEVLLAVLYPRLIAPLFNRFTPLPEGEVREQVESLAQRLGFRTRGIFLMDGSRRSSHGNAYLTGLGRDRRIVLFDTLLAILSAPQVAAVLAHEIGHQKKLHVPLRLAATLVGGLAAFWLLDRALSWEPLFRAFGFAAGSGGAGGAGAAAAAPAAVVLLLFFAGPLSLALRPLGSWLSRRQEYAADRYAYRQAGCGESFTAALLALARGNLANPTPHPWTSFWFASHPTVLERVRALRGG